MRLIHVFAALALVTPALAANGISYLGDLVERSACDLLATPNIGRKSLGEIEKTLARIGVQLGMGARGLD